MRRVVSLLVIIAMVLNWIGPVLAQDGQGDLEIDPKYGPAQGGMVVTITGPEFQVETDEEGEIIWPVVTFGGNRAEVLEASGTDLEVLLPSRDDTGEVRVVVRESGGQIYEGTFTYVLAPIVSYIAPPYGPTSGGPEIHIVGSNFLYTPPESEVAIDYWEKDDGGAPPVEVYFGEGDDSQQEVLRVSNNEIVIRLRPGTPGPKLVTVKNVADPHDEKNVGRVAYVENGFTYVVDRTHPEIEGVTPNAGPVGGGTRVTIEGTQFIEEHPLDDGEVLIPEVYFGENRAQQVEYVDYNTLIATAPANWAGGWVDIRAVNPDGGEGIFPQGFWYKPQAAAIFAITPDEGPLGDRIWVQVDGANIPQWPLEDGQEPEWALEGEVEEMALFIGGQPAGDLRVESANTLIAQTPTEGGELHEPVDVVLRILSRVNIGGEELVIEEEARLPQAFTFVEPRPLPQVEEIINPETGTNEGPLQGGITVEVIGRNFRSGVEFYFGDHPEPAEPVGPIRVEEKEEDGQTVTYTSQEVLLPPAGQPGAVTVRVKNQDGSETITPRAFIYRGNTLVLIGVTPDKGSVGGGELVEIRGENLSRVTDVTFGGEEAEIIEKSDTLLEVVTPPFGESAGPVDIVVKDPFGSRTLPESFTYYVEGVKPEVTGVQPLWGPRTGGTEVIVEGHNFMSGAQVYFDGRQALEAEVIRNPKEEGPRFVIRAVTPPGETGWSEIVVKNPLEKESDPLEQAFYYQSRPEIKSLDPATGTIGGGTIVQVEGEDFLAQAPEGEENLEELLPEEGFAIYLAGQEMDQWELTQTGLTFQVPLGNYGEGPVDLTVVNADGGQVTAIGAFTFVRPRTIPEIAELEPEQGTLDGGTDVVISGDQFREPRVFFGLREAQLDSSFINQLRVRTPAGGKEGPVDVTVINTDGGLAVLQDGFQYLYATSWPEIDRVFPAEGPASGGTTIIVSGVGFLVQDGQKPRVYIGERQAQVIEVTDNEGDPVDGGFGTRIQIVTPGDYVGTYDLVVINPDTALARLGNAFTYKDSHSRPQITGVVPDRGPGGGGTQVVVTGADFMPGASLFFDGEQAQGVEVIDSETILGVTPPGTLGDKDVTVINPDGASYTRPGGFTYLPHPDSRPAIYQVVPAEGSTEGGTRLRISGREFDDQVRVFIGWVEAEEDLEVSSDGREITVLTPPGTPGSRDVFVYNPDGGSALLQQGFTYREIDEAPVIAGVEPSYGPTTGGIPVAIEGSGFQPGARVFFGEREPAEVTVQSPGLLTMWLPPGEEGAVDLLVLNPDGGSDVLAGGFEYVPPPEEQPVLERVEPSSGRTTGGTPVEITGRGFLSGASLFFGDTPASDVEVRSATRITARTPAGSAGDVNLTLVNPDGGVDVLVGGFTYIQQDGPVIESLEPDTGSTAGGTQVEIRGRNFDAGLRVFFGDELGETVALSNGTTITVRTPSHDPGPVAVTVVNPDGTEGSLEGAFTYEGPPLPPQGLEAAVIDDHTIALYWEPVVGAQGYEVYGRRYRDDDLEFLGSTPNTYYYVTGLRRDTRYYFEIRAINEHGISEAVQTVSARTSRDGTGTSWWRSQDNQLLREGDRVTLLVREAGFGSRRVYHLDLGESEFAGAREFIFNLPIEAVERTTTLVIEGEGLRLEVPLSLFTQSGLQNLTSTQRRQAYGRLVLERVGGWEGEVLHSLLPSGTQPVSPAYRLKAQVQIGRDIREVGLFSPRVQVELAGERGVEMALYHYEPGKDVWDEIGGSLSRYTGWVSRQVRWPGIYLAVARRS